MSSIGAARRKLDLGRVFGDTFGVVRRQGPLLIGISFVLSFLPNLIYRFSYAGMLKASAPPFGVYSDPLYGLMSLANLVLGALLISAQIHIAIQDLDGRRAAPAEVLRAAISKFLPIIGAILLMGLGLILGFVLLLVPGAILGVMWIATLPAVVGETSNVFRAFGKSRELTRGNRWRIFGLLVLVWLAALVVDGVLIAAAGGVHGLYGGGEHALTYVLLSLVSFAFSLLGGVGLAALYVQLRELKGGGGEAVAQVFA